MAKEETNLQANLRPRKAKRMTKTSQDALEKLDNDMNRVRRYYRYPSETKVELHREFTHPIEGILEKENGEILAHEVIDTGKQHTDDLMATVAPPPTMRSQRQRKQLRQ